MTKTPTQKDNSQKGQHTMTKDKNFWTDKITQKTHKILRQKIESELLSLLEIFLYNKATTCICLSLFSFCQNELCNL